MLVTSPCPECTIEGLENKIGRYGLLIKVLFYWTYGEKEIYLFLEGELTVTPEGEDPVTFGTGELVMLLAGMDFRWDVHKIVRKYYRLGD